MRRRWQSRHHGTLNGRRFDMPILKLVLPDDSFAALAWRTCVVILALQNILHGDELDPEEREALTKLSKDVSDLATVMHQGVKTFLLQLDEPLLNLSRLVGLGAQTAGHELNLDQLKENLCHIVKNLTFYPLVRMDDALLEWTQKAVSELNKRANHLRPQSNRSPLTECVA